MMAEELTSAVLGDIPMLVATGAMDRDASASLQSALGRLTEARHNIVFLDLSNLTGMDTAGLSVLLTWVQALRGKGWLGVIAPDVTIRRLLESEGLLRHPNVRIFENRHAALVATGERQST
jgi:anti-anti-sigma factor